MPTDPESIFAELGAALDEESWEWLSEANPKAASGVRTAIRRGALPYDVRRFVQVKTRREEISMRCQQAAQHIQAQRDQLTWTA